jgi:hypothetical protein
MVVILQQGYVSIAGSLQAMLEAKGRVSLIHDDNKWLVDRSTVRQPQSMLMVCAH